MAFNITDVQKALAGFDYPGTGEQLAEHAAKNGAPDELVQALRGIRREVDGPNAVMKELQGQLTGAR
jgi:hypothetical protein